jgi:hypothetical protein
MDRATAYDEDIYAWSQEQAAALRRLAQTRRDMPNVLDLEHVADEIEDVGKSELRAVESALELLLRHLVKLASAPDAPPTRHWRKEVLIQHRAVRGDLKNSMMQLMSLDEIWDVAKARADAALDNHGDALVAELPERCPFSLDELLAEPFDVDEAASRLRAAGVATRP